MWWIIRNIQIDILDVYGKKGLNLGFGVWVPSEVITLVCF